VGKRVFQNRGVCRQALPSLPTPTSLFPPFCSCPIFRAARFFRSRRLGTLATQAINRVTKHEWTIIYKQSFAGHMVAKMKKKNTSNDNTCI